MIGINEFTVAAIASVAVLFASAAQAIEIERFDKLAISDQGDYVARLIQGAQKTLADAGKGDQAVKLNKLFGEVRAGDKMSIGMIGLEENLARARVADAERYAKNHDAPRLEVEHALILTLKKNAIDLPQAIMRVMDDFRPNLPPTN